MLTLCERDINRDMKRDCEQMEIVKHFIIQFVVFVVQ